MSLTRCVVVMLALAFGAACAESSPGADDAAGAAGTGASGAGTPGGGNGGASASGGGGNMPETPEDVPATELPADPLVDCPAAFTMSAPVAGPNTQFDVAGQSRSFHLLLPDASAFPGPRPLFVAWHGTSQLGAAFADRVKLQDFADRGFIAVAPDGVGNGTIWPVWDAMHSASDPDTDNKDLALFDTLVRCLAAHHAVDQNRIYTGGHSAGGIMSNYVLQRRSELLAGGIVGSGVFSLTEPKQPTALDGMLVIVTWGGDNDEWTGSTTSGVAVPQINFVEQAALASQHYAAAPAVGQVHCRGNNVGHAWLDPINDGLIDMLLAHPQGLSGADGVNVPASTAGICANEPYAFDGGLTSICPTQTTVPGCEVACQLFADCAVENLTVGPILATQLSALGFSGEDNTDCTGCVDNCEATATTQADAEVLDCIETQAQAAMCGPGIDGALPAIDAVNTCCNGRSDSPMCVQVCTIMLTNSATESFVPNCVPLAG